MDRLSRVLLRSPGEKIALITSVAGEGIMKAFLDYFKTSYNPPFQGGEVELLVVENRFFASSIISAGLLTISDIITQLKKIGKYNDLLILPGIIFDIFGNDLTGKNFLEIEEGLNISLKII